MYLYKIYIIFACAILIQDNLSCIIKKPFVIQAQVIEIGYLPNHRPSISVQGPICFNAIHAVLASPKVVQHINASRMQYLQLFQVHGVLHYSMILPSSSSSSIRCFRSHYLLNDCRKVNRRLGLLHKQLLPLFAFQARCLY